MGVLILYIGVCASEHPSMSDTKAVYAPDYCAVAPWCTRNPRGKVILGVSTLADAAVVGSAVPRAWTGTTRIVFADDGAISPGLSKMLAVARVRVAFARHRCAWTVVQ